MTFRCLVVDDEPLARRLLARHLEQLPSLRLVGQCVNATEAAAFLHQQPIDVLFLDIRMPGLSGLDFLATLVHRPQVILTTAYSEYALEGYEHAVVDYLLKPISFERFLKAVNKLKPVAPDAADGSLLLRMDGATQRVNLEAIVMVEACGNYVKIHTRQERLLASETMKKMESALPPDRFLRVHRSYIVAVDKIERLAGGHLTVAGHEIPVGRSYRRTVEARLLPD
ncbi:MAG: response regulator transcription factor [bacterium]|nr:response regulator transcription factor [bacterium]